MGVGWRGSPVCPKLLISLERATEKKHCQRHNRPED